MGPNRGITAHFAASKASISRANRSVKSRLAKDNATPAPTADVVSHPSSQPSASTPNHTENGAALDITTLKPTSPKKSTPKRQTRTRLRTPDQGEVDQIMAENQSLLQSSPSARLAAAAAAAASSSSRHIDEPVSLLGTPPTTPRASGGSHASPISVRTDPDTNKMYLMLSRSPSKPSTSATRGDASASTSSPSKRKMATPPKSTSPTKTPRTLQATPRRLITGETETLGTEEEDGLVLTPGRAKGTRVMLGSPSKSPLLTKLDNTPKGQALRRIVDEDDEGYLTPRSVRQKPKGLPLPPLATQNAAAVFRGAQLPASSSAPSLGQANDVPASSSAIASGLSYSEVDSSSVPLAEEDEAKLPQPKHALSSDLALPSFYSSLMSLHVALEHALVVHLATAGCASATLESSTQSSDDDNSDTDQPIQRKRTKTVRLPNLVSYTALRPLVERSGGRRLGPTELKRLASVWLDFQRSSKSAKEEEEEVRGLGFIISKTRSMDARTGRRALDWGIGIELEIKRTIRERTPPTQVNFGGVEVQASPVLPAEGFDESVKGTPKMPSTRFSTPPPSSERNGLRSPYVGQHSSSPLFSSPRRKQRVTSPSASASPKTRSSAGAAKAREGMSVVAMWNNGLETRKAEVGRRLRERCARYHQLWLDERGISVPICAKGEANLEVLDVEPATPSRRKQRMIGLGIASTADSNGEEGTGTALSSPSLPREAVMGAGGLLTPSATRSGGRRVGKRMFHMDPSELDRDGLISSGEDDDDEGLAASALRKADQGKQTLIDEVSTSVVRGSRSMPQLRSTTSTATTVEEDNSSSLPAEGSLLHSWHPDFPLDDPRVVRPHPTRHASLPHCNPSHPASHQIQPRSASHPTETHQIHLERSPRASSHHGADPSRTHRSQGTTASNCIASLATRFIHDAHAGALTTRSRLPLTRTLLDPLHALFQRHHAFVDRNHALTNHPYARPAHQAHQKRQDPTQPQRVQSRHRPTRQDCARVLGRHLPLGRWHRAKRVREIGQQY